METIQYFLRYCIFVGVDGVFPLSIAIKFLKTRQKKKLENTVFSSTLYFFGVSSVIFYLSLFITVYKYNKSTIKIKKRVVIIYKMVVARVCYLDHVRYVKPPTIFELSYSTLRRATNFSYRMVTGEKL